MLRNQPHRKATLASGGGFFQDEEPVGNGSRKFIELNEVLAL